MWCCKDDISPSSRYIYQGFPPQTRKDEHELFSIEMEYLQEGIVREDVNSRQVYSQLAIARHRHRIQNPP